MITQVKVEQEIARAMEVLDQSMTRLADSIRSERVIPACCRINGSFASGMGTFCFYDQKDRPIMEWDAKKFRLENLYARLNTEVYGHQVIGF